MFDDLAAILSRMRETARMRANGLWSLPEQSSGRGRVLHISDTPRTIFGMIADLVDFLEPSVIIHTGDLVDDVKLEIYPRETHPYVLACKKLFRALAGPDRTVYIAIGNHDNADVLPPLPEGFVVCKETTTFDHKNKTFTISHYPPADDEADGSTFRLFGHDMSVLTGNRGETCLLNGLEAMWLIDPDDETATRIDYPKSTNAARMLRRRHRAW